MNKIQRLLDRHPLLVIFVVALLLRLPLIDGSIDFFDSPQYLWRAVLPTIVEAMSTGHAPYHPGYVGWIWVVHQLLPSLPTALAAVWVNVVFSTLGLVATFLLADRLFNSTSKVERRGPAWLATALVALTPYFWVGSITILVDPVMLAWWILSLFLFDIGLERRSGGWYLLSGVCLGLAMLAHTQIAFWSLGYVALILIRRSPKDWVRTVIESLPFALGPLLAISAYVVLLLHAGHDQSVGEALSYLLRGNAGDHAPFALDLTIRNTRLVLGSVLALAALVSSVMLIRRSPKLGWGLSLWLWPGAVVSSAYLYSNLAGRATMPGTLPAALLVAAALVAPEVRVQNSEVGRNLIVALIVGSLLLTSLPLVWRYATGPSINEAMDNVRAALPQGGEYLASPESRTLSSYNHELYVYDDAQATIEEHLRAAVAAGKPAFVASDAITFPGYSFDGQSLRVFAPSVTRGDHGGQASFLFNEFTADVVRDVPATPALVYGLGQPGSTGLVSRYRRSIDAIQPGSRVIIGRIVDAAGQAVSRLEVNVHGTPATNPLRIDAHDWLATLIRSIGVAVGYQTTDPLAWGYTDPEGVVAVKLPDTTEAHSFRLVPHPLDTARTQTPPPLFVRQDTTTIRAQGDVVEGSASEVAQRLADTSGGVLAAVERTDADRYRATVTAFSYQLSAISSVPAGILPSSVGELTADGRRLVPAGEVGDATFGPWKQLAPGRYAATWRLERVSEGEGTVAKLDVSAGFGAQTLAEQFVDAAELPLNEPTDLTLEFEVSDSTGLIEFRTRAHGGPGFIVESLTVQPK